MDFDNNSALASGSEILLAFLGKPGKGLSAKNAPTKENTGFPAFFVAATHYIKLKVTVQALCPWSPLHVPARQTECREAPQINS